MTWRIMIDSDDLAHLTITAPLIATYADLWRDGSEILKAHPHSILVWIDRGLGDPKNVASVLDVENVARKVGDIPGWMDDRRERGIFPTIYHDRNTTPAVLAAIGNRKSPFHWISTLDGTAHIGGFTPGHSPAAVQILGENQLGVHADLSLVYEDNWHPAP